MSSAALEIGVACTIDSTRSPDALSPETVGDQRVAFRDVRCALHRWVLACRKGVAMTPSRRDLAVCLAPVVVAVGFVVVLWRWC
jgi:hypothetical protein